MKKKIWICIAGVVLLAILFVPIPSGTYKDGGTRAYSALTYKIVKWQRDTGSDVYKATRVYWLPNNFKSMDSLWAGEEASVPHHFTATVLKWRAATPWCSRWRARWRPAWAARSRWIPPLWRTSAPKWAAMWEIYYTGNILETSPARLRPTKWEMATDLRHRAYTDSWLNPETAQPMDEMIDPLIISRIYSNCFFARPVVPMPYEIKFNGELPPEWCVGDQVTCTCENILYDQDNQRMEADFISLAPSDWQMDPIEDYKPVIYLYPEEETQVSVHLTLDGDLTCTYPAYQDGWTVTAAPDGTLTDERGQTYNYLYWEGETYARWDMTRGFCVKGSDTAAFWSRPWPSWALPGGRSLSSSSTGCPLWSGTPYNLISFQTDAYTQAAGLPIDPAPDTLLRVFMAWQPLD